MKTLSDLFELVAKAVKENHKYNTWFIDFSGHINTLRAEHYMGGWSEDNKVSESFRYTLDEDGIQAAYWAIKTRLRK